MRSRKTRSLARVSDAIPSRLFGARLEWLAAAAGHRRGGPGSPHRRAGAARRLAVLGAVAAAALGLVASAPAQASAGPHATFTSLGLEPVPLTAAPALAARFCVPSIEHYNRTQVCWAEVGTITIEDEDGEPIGTVVVTMVQSIQLHVIGRSVSESLAVTSVTTDGKVPKDIEMFLDAHCGLPCTTTVHFPQGALLETGVVGTIDHHDSIGTGKVHSTRTTYELELTAPDTIFTPGIWHSPLYYRCDDQFATQGAGCVFPSFIPTLTSMTSLPAIAANIRRIQDKGPGHYGRPGSGHPLHRLVNAALQLRNYRAVCRRPGQKPPHKGLSCDEYPFKTTYEGGTALSAANRGWAWVPTGEQNRQGGLISAFYRANRILNKDAFWVEV
jgi:hypothetical protein